ncbi:MAG: hypothetical protein ACR650_09875 [Methylocystis sp.]
MPDGSPACLAGLKHGSLEERVAALLHSVDLLRDELSAFREEVKPLLDAHQQRIGRDKTLRDLGALVGGLVAGVGALFGLFKFLQSNGWIGK